MIRLRRAILAALTVLSTFLFLASALFWCRSYRHNDMLRFYGKQRNVELVTGRGRVLCHAERWVSPTDVNDTAPWLAWDSTPASSALEAFRFYARAVTVVAGFSTASGKMTSSYLSLEYHWRDLTVPFWFLCLLFAIVPTVHFATHIRRRRRQLAGFCKRCGYDLRATPDRCPECGTAPNGS